MTPGNYLRLRREGAGYSLDDVALMTETIPPISARSRSEWLDAIERGTAPVPIGAALRLQQLLEFDWRVFVAVCAAAEGLGDLPQICRVCACSEWDPCTVRIGAPGVACAWAEETLCTFCVSRALAAQVAA